MASLTDPGAAFGVPGADPDLINDDIRPVRDEERHWSVMSMAALWIGMVVCVPTYTLAGGLIDQGMSWWQAVLTIMLANLIVLVPMILNGHAGTAHGVPFPVLARASFGVNGAHIPSLLRALVACGWFGIQTWFGGFSIYQLVNAVSGDALVGADLPLLGINPGELACYLFFWGIQVGIIYKGVESIRKLEDLAAPFLIAIGLALLGWAYVRADGFGAMLANQGQFGLGGAKEGQFWAVFAPSLTGMVGFWATLSLNIPDFTRYAKTQRDQVLGQAIGLPTTMTLFAFISVAVTSATTVIFADPATGAPGAPIWDPTVLAGKIGGGLTVGISLLALAIATLSTNIAANVVSPANALINAAPQRVNFRVGGLVTAGLGLVILPWKLIETTGGYIFTWLVGYSALLGPIGGVMLADYFILRRTHLDRLSLYRRDGAYQYTRGFNPAALLAFGLGVLPNVPGFLHQAGLFGEGVVPAVFDTLYTYAWFVGTLSAAGLYLLFMRLMPPASPTTAPKSEPT
jgi:NCS1 family nucleobase:cation symporter-1